VAVAGRLAPCAIGTDTGGSVRLPSSFCGIVGLKTTIGRISTHGVLPLAPTLDTPGPMTRSVEDAALLFRLLQGRDPLDPRTALAPPGEPGDCLRRGVDGLRLAVLPPAEREGVDPEVLAAYDAATEVLARAGASLIEAPLPCPIAVYGQLSGDIMTTEGYALMGEIAERNDLPTDQDVRPRFLQARSRTAREYLQWLRDREAKKREFARRFAGLDAFLTPTTPFAALPIRDIDQKSHPARFTRMVHGLDLCALALPNGFTRDGLPTSLQIIAQGYDEASALRIGWAFEQATEWHERRPPEI
jgi:aspartyl-tRNA(Asn)/glutamyl-tRNA(Gln) amidotransferase subunit A